MTKIYKLIEQRNIDGHAWAESFCSMYPSIDKELMTSWFCSAMMTMYDRINGNEIRPLKKSIEQLEQLLGTKLVQTIIIQNKLNLSD